MDDLANNEEILVRYLDGELPAAEKAEVEQRLQNEEALREQLLNLQLAVQAVRQYGTAKQVEDIHGQMMQELKPGMRPAKSVSIKRIVRFTMAIAASMLLVFFGIRLYTASQLTPEKIYKDSFVDFNAGTTRGGGAGSASVIERFYRQKSYTSVIRANPTSAKDSLLVGLSYLQTGQSATAIDRFLQLTERNNEYQPDAEFYLALSYVKNKEYNKALPWLQKIQATPSHLYHQQVSEDIVEKVKKLNAG